MSHLSLHTPARRLLTALAMALLAVGIFGPTQQASARLDPFYIVTGSASDSAKARILFLLDNSGSMALDVTYNPGAPVANSKC